MKANYRSWVQLMIAIIATLFGLTLVGLALFMPPRGVIDPTVLTAYGETLTLDDNFKLPISAYAPGCVPKVKIKERLDNHNQTSSQEQYAAYCRFPRERFSEENHSKEDCEHQAAFVDRNNLAHLSKFDSIEVADPRSASG